MTDHASYGDSHTHTGQFSRRSAAMHRMTAETGFPRREIIYRLEHAHGDNGFLVAGKACVRPDGFEHIGFPAMASVALKAVYLSRFGSESHIHKEAVAVMGIDRLSIDNAFVEMAGAAEDVLLSGAE